MKKINVSAACPLPDGSLDIKDLYSESDLRAIAEAAGIVATEEFRSKIREIIWKTNVALCLDASKASSQQMRKELNRALDLNRKFRAAMWSMSNDASSLVIKDVRYYTSNLDEDEKRLDEASRNLDLQLKCLQDMARLEHLIEDALARVPKGERGRPSYKSVGYIVAELRALWIEHTGSKPTLSYSSSGRYTSGAFLNFCRLAIGPILKRHDIDSDLEATVRQVVYEEKYLPNLDD